MACVSHMRLSLRALDLRYASAVDTAISKVLKSEEDSAAEAQSTDAQRQKVAQFVQAALSNHSARAPLQGASTTVAQAIDSPSADLRRMVSLNFILRMHAAIQNGALIRLLVPEA